MNTRSGRLGLFEKTSLHILSLLSCHYKAGKFTAEVIFISFRVVFIKLKKKFTALPDNSKNKQKLIDNVFLCEEKKKYGYIQS